MNEFPVKNTDPFEEKDPYNPQNIVRGLISRESTEFYGALKITHINNNPVSEQLIMGTPKMHYPFYTTQTGERKYESEW